MRTTLLTAGLVWTALAVGADTAPTFDDQRLFTTADQRKRLDTLRAERAQQERARQAEAEQAAGQSESSERAREASSGPVDLRGYIQRSDGPPAYWVNEGSSLDPNGLPGDLRIRSGRIDDGTVIVTLPDGRSVRLAPGQTWDPEAGRVVDSYER